MDKHLQSHSPAQLSEIKFHSFSIFGNLTDQALSGISHLVDAPMPDHLSFNFSLGAKCLHSTLQLSGQQQKCLKHHILHYSTNLIIKILLNKCKRCKLHIVMSQRGLRTDYCLHHHRHYHH